MKNQYFADVNDYRKYGLLRSLMRSSTLQLGICWMLTPDDGRTDGKFLSYLTNPTKYRQHDPDLFDHLHASVQTGNRTISHAHSPALFDRATFHDEILADDRARRSQYFDQAASLFANHDLIFFDPDNGMATPTCMKGRKDSCKYLFWDELSAAYESGASILVYQHFIREKRTGFTQRLAAELGQHAPGCSVFSFSTPHVLFLLAAQPRHTSTLSPGVDRVRHSWHGQISVATH